MNITELSPEVYLENAVEIDQVLNDPEKLNQIPFLNHLDVSLLKDTTLVRFRGMIQDMLDPELYLEKYEVQNENGSRLQDGKYRDTLVLKPGEKVNYDSASNVHGERRSMFVVSVPGLNKWATEMEKTNFNCSACTSADNSLATSSNNPAASGNKRCHEEEVDMETDAPNEEHVSKKVTSPNELKGNNADKPGLVLSAEYLLNSPIPDRPSKACLVKVYRNFDNFTLNTVVDIVGFLSVDPALDGTFDDEDGFFEESERQATNPPPSLIPRLHAIKIKKLSHVNPLTETLTNVNDIKMEEAYKDLRLALTQMLFEDAVAAEYLLAHLISTVHTRNEIHALGKWSINLSQIPTQVVPDFITSLYEIIEMLVPASHYFPMTLDNLNTLQFVPKKDYKTSKLTSGLLQLAPHTHLVLDETRLQVGKLEAAGVEAVKNLAQIINTQRLKYNFQYYEIEFDTDIPIMILSEGKSMLPNDCHIPLQSSADSVKLMQETFTAVKHFLQPKLNSIRTYLTKQRQASFNVQPEESEMIQNDFVAMRRENEQITGEDLHSLLVLSRLIGLSRGKSAMDAEIWEYTKQLERERKDRIQALNHKRNEL